MRPGAVKVETAGSFWWLDDAAGEYLRLPKTEGPRERPEWSDERAGVLQDGVWHPMQGWDIGFPPGAVGMMFPGLMIRYETPDGVRSTWAPDALVVS